MTCSTSWATARKMDINVCLYYSILLIWQNAFNKYYMSLKYYLFILYWSFILLLSQTNMTFCSFLPFILKSPICFLNCSFSVWLWGWHGAEVAIPSQYISLEVPEETHSCTGRTCRTAQGGTYWCYMRTAAPPMKPHFMIYLQNIL